MTPLSPCRSVLLLIALVVALGGCASGTTLSSRWHDPYWHSGPLRNVYVIAVRKDPVRRRQWEDACVAGLKTRGVKAIPSYVEFPNAVPDTQQVVDAIQAAKYDGVVVSLRLETTQEQREVPATTSVIPETRHNPYTGMYYTVYREVYTPGYTETNEIRRFQTDIWSTGGDGRLVWSASASIYDPMSADVMQDLIGKKILPAAAKDGVFP
jgi:hypothetical protein